MMGLRLVFGIILVLLAGSLSADETTADEKNVRVGEAQQFAQGNKVAVIVGVNTYDQESGLRPLKYAAADADALTAVLQKHGYAARTLTNQKATKSYILNAIKQAGETLNPQQGTLVFAFSGHGFAQGGNNYLASYGTVGGNLSESALSMQELEQAVRATKVRRAVLFIDACRDNPGLEGSKSIGQPSFIQQQSEGIQVLYATKFGEISWEHDSLKHGVFSYFLQKALNGEAADTQGAISFDNLKSYVQQQVANWIFTNLARTQKPFSMGENYGIFMLAGVGGAPAPHPVPIPAPPPTPVPVARPEPESVQPKPVMKLFPAVSKVIEPQMVRIPAGSFTMGCVVGRDDVAEGCKDDEKPPREVTLRSYQVGRNEVTFDEWDVCEAAKSCPHVDGAYWGRGNHPVINVSWNDAQTYIQWLNKQTGKHYRLLTEAEWEYAARGGRNDTAYPWGNSINCSNADYWSGVNSCQGEGTSVVGSFAMNGYGLYDTAGNVWEWTEDCYVDSYNGVLSDNSARSNCGTDVGRVVRGGSWGNDGGSVSSATQYGDSKDWLSGGGVRSAIRGKNAPDNRDLYVGFRIALDH